METVGGRLQSLSCTDVRLAGHGGEGKHHYPYSQAPVRKHRATHRALSLGFFYTSDSVVMKQKKQKIKNTQPLNVAALCTLHAEYPLFCDKAPEEGNQKGEEEEEGEETRQLSC